MSNDNNVCPGDYGTPLYEVVKDDKGKVTSQKVVGIALYGNTNFATCLGRHPVFFIRVALPAVKGFIDETIAAIGVV